ncbi:hydrogenase nickel incorporation protein HypB [Campylobacter porcelli]|uniref:Hydrogenase nickel insertion protein HypB n=1 Tax=Campylobacter porcelli TaxID=1660073 RepID=A0A1X9SXG6_9BACT|nr:hydrogenase nickel incorporation protein HypB [Campylobacter sp. RM6137]ARR00972.1 hydrogenase nickel insertion protein HypB [Campylobacter sp. RM6137]
MCKDCGCSMGGSHHHSHDDHHNHHHHGHHDHPVLNEKKTIEVVEKILKDNDYEAEHNRAHLDECGLLCINLMSSPGAGKTTLLEATIKASGLRIGVVEGDLETNMDANRIINAGGKAYQISTGQTCHLDAFMVHNGLHHLPLKELDLVFVENVGNLVCPASYDVGAHINAVLISVPEGSDKIAKYPVMFRAADIVIITKTSLLEHFDFNIDEVKKEARKLNPKVDIIEVDSKSGAGVDKWINYIKFKKEIR